jgi:hypothetical protein
MPLTSEWWKNKSLRPDSTNPKPRSATNLLTLPCGIAASLEKHAATPLLTTKNGSAAKQKKSRSPKPRRAAKHNYAGETRRTTVSGVQTNIVFALLRNSLRSSNYRPTSTIAQPIAANQRTVWPALKGFLPSYARLPARWRQPSQRAAAIAGGTQQRRWPLSSFIRVAKKRALP